MLVLTVKRNRRVIITMPDGRLITLMVCEIDAGKVRIGIAAPEDVTIDRDDVHDRKQHELGDPIA